MGQPSGPPPPSPGGRRQMIQQMGSQGTSPSTSTGNRYNNNNNNSNQLAHPDDDSGDITQSTDQRNMLKAARSGIRRFSVSSMPQLHQQSAPAGSPIRMQSSNPNDTQFEVDEYGNKIQSKAMLQLSESLADMYNGIKGHVKNIRSFQKKSDNMNYKDDYGEGQMKIQQPKVPGFKANELRNRVDDILSRVGLDLNTQPQLWHKNLRSRKWTQEIFSFEWPQEGTSGSATVTMIVGDEKYYFNMQSKKAMLPHDWDAKAAGIKPTKKRSKKAVRKLYELHVMHRGHGSKDTPPGIVIVQTEEQRNALKLAIDLIVTAVQDHHHAKMMAPQAGPVHVDPQEMADQAQCFEAYGAGLFDAVVGEWASFEILPKDEGKYSSEGAAREWSTVVSISISPPSFKPLSLYLSCSPLSKTPKQVFFNPINIFDSFTHSITVL